MPKLTNKPEIYTFKSTGKSLNQLYRENKDLFFSNWFKDEKFTKEKGKPKTIHLLTEPYPNSNDKTYEEQKALIGSDEYIPTVREVVEGISSYYKKNKVMLFEDVWVRCSDISSHGSRVLVRFDSDGLYVSYCDDYRYSRLGVAVASKSLKPRTLETSGKLETRVLDLEKRLKALEERRLNNA
jgi:hypothetical protein